jgi:Fe-S oxidoreductase
MGEEYLYQTAAEENVANLARIDFDRIVCHCPHCYNTLRNEYPQFGARYDVVHHSELIEELLQAGRLPRAAASGHRVAFHDSCYLGRYNQVFAAPRQALAASGAQTVELERRLENGLCCGGGGGKMWFEDGRFERKVEDIRMAEVAATRPDALGVACPFCLTMLDGAAKNLGADPIPVLDIAEILERALAESSVARSDGTGED